MQGKGHRSEPSNSLGDMPATDDEIQEKYLERAIRELNQLTRAVQECDHCPRGNLMRASSPAPPRPLRLDELEGLHVQQRLALADDVRVA